MVILRMQATFGCLDGAVLELSDGLNCLVLPNGAGKSTWAAFLTAMFYGVDPAARKSRGRLPVRLQFAPWSGKPMAGIVHLKLETREIILERTSAARPMDTFRAYDPVTGQAVAGLTGDNCGQVLWGVEREVFLRTAMIGGDLSVTADQALLQRLQNLAATGRESDSARAAAETLKAWKNRCRYHNTGLLPETEAAISSTKAALSRAEAAAAAQRKGAEALEQAEERAKLRRAALEREIAAARTAARAAAQAAEHDPPLETLLKLDAQAARLPGGGASLPPACRGKRPEALLPAAEQALETLRAPLPRWGLPLGGGALVLAVAAALLAAQKPVIAAGAGIAALCLLAWGAGALVRRRKSQKARQAILKEWQVDDPAALLPQAVACRDALLRDWEEEVLLEEVRAFAPETETTSQARTAIAQALARQQALARAQAALSAAERRRDGEGAEPLDALRAQAETLSRQAAALGDPDALSAKLQALEDTRTALQKRERALTLAMNALATAAQTLTEAYGPRLTAPAGRYLSALTGGQFDGLVLQDGQVLTARERSSGLQRPLEQLSRGTADQVWLSLRLALTGLLLPPAAPLILDDALLTFDGGRTAAALQQLRREGRQILLFSCRKLEESS